MQPDPRSEMDRILAWLRVQLDAIEKVALAAQPGPWHIGNAVDPTQPCNVHTFPGASGVADGLRWLDAEHVALNGPDAVLAQVAAHRAILDECEVANAGTELGVAVTPEEWTAQTVIRHLAAAYAHRDESGSQHEG